MVEELTLVVEELVVIELHFQVEQNYFYNLVQTQLQLEQVDQLQVIKLFREAMVLIVQSEV